MSGQQSQSRNRFTPGLLAMGIWAATTQAALGAEEQPATTMELGATQISSDQLGSTTEGSQSYTTGPMQTATKLPLTIRETPQAVTVVTRQRMDDQAMTSINDVVRYTPGLFWTSPAGRAGKPTRRAVSTSTTSCTTACPPPTRATRQAFNPIWPCSIMSR